ncbi:cytochrome P450 [Suillus paluster]|uniref:cytochrome P450 n=1 Tax=Suillus paluster TaxID=48578 RepID=UPI001B85D1EC|nr:cytochrome P450 [Suillus paluster]KAG1742264.1 cytochrome P450 [Suillus paluster]
MLFAYILAVAIPCIISLVAALHLSCRRVYPLPLPPGPRPLPFLGKFIHSRILGIDLVVINSEKIAQELLDKRSAIYSDRPVIRTNELAGLAFNAVLLPYGETLRRHRKIFHQVLRAEASVSYHEMYSHHANELVINLLDATSDMQKHTEVYTGSLIMAVTYGHTARGHDDPFLARAHELVDIAKHILSPERAAIFTAFPFRECLNAVDDVNFNIQRVGCSRKVANLLLNEPFDEAKAQMVRLRIVDALADFLGQCDDDAEEDTMKAVALMAYIGCIDTSTSTLQTFLLAMVLYPDVQARARAGINHVVGHDKMSCIDDRASLPYLDAVFREVLRWCPPIPLGRSAAI